METSLKFNYFIVILCVVLLAGCGTTKSLTERAEKKKNITEKVENKEYLFNAERVIPTSMSSLSLTPGYTFKISDNKIISHLPFFGKAYRAPMGIDNGGVKFETDDFEYNAIKDSKKDKWDIKIRCKLRAKIVDIQLEIWSNGRASLSVNDPDKESISYQGYIE